LGIEPQSSTTNGLDLRGEVLWSARATISLPVPVSPVMSTVSSLGATFSRLGEDLAHRRRAADDRVEAVALRQLDLDDVLHRLELDLGVADAEHRAGRR
jgi:hypothetical protein